MIKAALLLFPIVVTGSLFLILYNNTYHGRMILIGLVLLNMGILMVRAGRGRLRDALAWARFSALCLIGGLAALLLVEALFPLVLPREYNQILDLSKSFIHRGEPKVDPRTVVFENPDQRIRHPQNGPSEAELRVKSWHTPGQPFTYYGYDPNSMKHYVNKFRWNSHGYFDHDYDYTRPEGVYRIVVIGDSYVEAAQVPLSRSFHKLVEADLNTGAAVSDLRPKIEVIALGNSGTGQVEHFKVLRERAALFKPDIVAVALCSNDFCDDDPHLKEQLRLTTGGVLPRIRNLVSHGFFALAFAENRIEDLRRNRVNVCPELLQWADSRIPEVEEAWARTLGTIRASRDFCQTRGLTFLLVYLGSDLEVKYAIDPEGTIERLKAMGGPHKQIKWDMNKSVNRVKSYCEENDIIMISLLEPLIEAQKETGKPVFGDHYTMFGHQVAAQVLARAIDFRLQTHVAETPTLRRTVSPESGGTNRPTLDASRTVQPSEVNFVPASAEQVPAR
ncbi:MAG: SGNH/GDSL hydrolase family protein [Desulfomonile tiedjei]|nr:SGNH/GDSL hydrolase family protein [Desulfomonile tiedjei]